MQFGGLTSNILLEEEDDIELINVEEQEGMVKVSLKEKEDTGENIETGNKLLLTIGIVLAEAIFVLLIVMYIHRRGRRIDNIEHSSGRDLIEIDVKD
jgi:hypothetical protein